jgi:hypothetical protein
VPSSCSFAEPQHAIPCAASEVTAHAWLLRTAIASIAESCANVDGVDTSPFVPSPFW